MLVGIVDVSEVFSPPRVTEVAKKMGLTAGTSFDITTVDDVGEPWDFNIQRMRIKAKIRVQEEKPELLIVGNVQFTCGSSHTPK